MARFAILGNKGQLDVHTTWGYSEYFDEEVLHVQIGKDGEMYLFHPEPTDRELFGMYHAFTEGADSKVFAVRRE